MDYWINKIILTLGTNERLMRLSGANVGRRTPFCYLAAKSFRYWDMLGNFSCRKLDNFGSSIYICHCDCEVVDKDVRWTYNFPTLPYDIMSLDDFLWGSLKSKVHIIHKDYRNKELKMCWQSSPCHVHIIFRACNETSTRSAEWHSAIAASNNNNNYINIVHIRQGGVDFQVLILIYWKRMTLCTYSA